MSAWHNNEDKGKKIIFIIITLFMIIAYLLFEIIIPKIIPAIIPKDLRERLETNIITNKNEWMIPLTCEQKCEKKGLTYAGIDEAGKGYTSQNISGRCVCINTTTWMKQTQWQ